MKSARKKESASDLSVESLARAQAFDGSYSPSPNLCRLFDGNDSLPAMPAALQTLAVNEHAKEALWCTTLVLAVLRVKFADEQDIWETFAEKALNWIKDTLSEDSAIDDERHSEIVEEVQVVAKAIIAAYRYA
jgi:hypothetical protein